MTLLRNYILPIHLLAWKVMIYDRFPLPESHIVRISLQVSTGLWWADAYERNYINIYIREGGGENSLKLCKNEAYADGRKLTDEADEGRRLMTMGATWRIFIGSRDCYPFWILVRASSALQFFKTIDFL